MSNETKVYLLYILHVYMFYHVQKKVSPMEFIEFFICCSVLLVAGYTFSLLKENELLTRLLVDVVNSCILNLHIR